MRRDARTWIYSDVSVAAIILPELGVEADP